MKMPGQKLLPTHENGRLQCMASVQRKGQHEALENCECSKVSREPIEAAQFFFLLKAGFTVLNHYVFVQSMLMPLMMETLTISPGNLLQCLLVILFNAFLTFNLIFLAATFCPVHWPHSTVCSCPLCSSSLYICGLLLSLPFSFYYVKESYSIFLLQADLQGPANCLLDPPASPQLS